MAVQESKARAYAESQSWEVERVYADEGVSGKNPDRRALTDLKRRIAEGGVDRLIVYSVSRFGRSARDNLNLLHEIEENGTGVVFLEPMVIDLSHRNMMSEMFVSMLSHLGEWENELRSVSVRDGMERSARDGRWQGGPTPYGFRINDDGILEVDPDQSEVIHLATKLILEGKSTREAADHLNAAGYRPPRSARWQSQELRRHLKRETLKGVHTWGDVTREIPQILDAGTFKRLQESLVESGLSRSGRNNNQWTLSQCLTCTCGGTFVGAGRRHHTSRTEAQRYYRCNRHQGDRKGECQCDHDDFPERPKWWNADDLELVAWRELLLVLSDRELLEEAMEAHFGHNSGLDDATFKKVVQSEKRLIEALVEAQADLYTAEDRLTQSKAIQRIRERLETTQAERQRLEELRTDEKRRANLRRAWVTVADDIALYSREPSPADQKAIFSRLNVRFQIRENVRVLDPSFSFKGGKQFRTFDRPMDSWLRIANVVLPSYNDPHDAHPCP